MCIAQYFRFLHIILRNNSGAPQRTIQRGTVINSSPFTSHDYCSKIRMATDDLQMVIVVRHADILGIPSNSDDFASFFQNLFWQELKGQVRANEAR